MAHREKLWLLIINGVVSCYLLSHAAQVWGAERPLLVFDEVQRADLTASFQTDCVESPEPANFRQLQKNPTKKNKFSLYFDPSSIELGKFGNFFLYTFYVAGINAHPISWQQCTAQVNPRGAFLDRNELVHFTIDHANVVDDGSLDLPIHSIASRDFLEVTTNPVPAKVNLSKSVGVDLLLHNLLSDMAILVESTVQTAATNQDYWQAIGDLKISDRKVIRIGPGETVGVRLPMEPKRLPALLSTLTSVKPEGVHDNLQVVLNYRSDFGGANRNNRTRIGVRFVPSFLNLFCALLIGSLLGTSAAQLLPGIWKGWKVAVQKAARGFLFSFIAELFAMLLIALGSKFVIIQFDLDPWQFLPVFFIGFLVSGGKEVLSYLGLTKPVVGQPAQSGVTGGAS